MAYAVIELLTLNFALNPLFCKTDVGGCAADQPWTFLMRTNSPFIASSATQLPTSKK